MDRLKNAERQASQSVEEARRARVERMKEAKAEAERQVNAYRAELEAKYKISESTVIFIFILVFYHLFIKSTN